MNVSDTFVDTSGVEQNACTVATYMMSTCNGGCETFTCLAGIDITGIKIKEVNNLVHQ